MTNDELNRKISEARQPKPVTHPRGLGRITDAWTFTEEMDIGGDGEPYMIGWQPKDWAGSEDASAVLLEEIAATRWVNIRVGIQHDPEYCGGPTVSIIAPGISIVADDRKRAIAEAWLKWKGIP